MIIVVLKPLSRNMSGELLVVEDLRSSVGVLSRGWNIFSRRTFRVPPIPLDGWLLYGNIVAESQNTPKTRKQSGQCILSSQTLHKILLVVDLLNEFKLSGSIQMNLGIFHT